MSAARRTSKRGAKSKSTSRRQSARKATKKKAAAKKTTKKKSAKKKTTKKKAANKGPAKRKVAAKASKKPSSKKKASAKKKTAKKKAAAKKKTAKKKAVTKKASKKKAVTKKTSKKKAATKKKVAKKKTATKKKAVKKKAAKKKATKKTATKKKLSAKKSTAKKPTTKKKASAQKKNAAKAKTAQSKITKKPAPAVNQKVTQRKAIPAGPVADAPTSQEGNNVAKVAKLPATKKGETTRVTGVLRISGGGARRTRLKALREGDDSAGLRPVARSEQEEIGARLEAMSRTPAPRIEVNPKLESSKGLLKGPPPQSHGVKPMSVAQKKRAEAEALFARIAKPGSISSAPPPPPPSTPGPGPDDFADGRISRRDSLTTMLRLAESAAQVKAAANELADDYGLPPDQSLLLKIVDLGEARLTKLALEELLELDDRGRVRASPELRSRINQVTSFDSETEELKQLLLEKIGA